MKQVFENIYRGAETSGADLLFNRFQATLDLESGSQTFGDGIPLLEAILGDQEGIRVWGHPLGGILPPSVPELKCGAVFLFRSNNRKIKTLVHCKHGVDRTGMTIAAHRIINEGWPPVKAAKECLEEGMHWVYIPWLIQLWRLK